MLPPHTTLSLCPVPRYFLQPRDNGSKSLKPGDLGSLRLNVVYTEDHVFSSDYYCPLRDLLLKSADVEVLLCQVYPPTTQSTCKSLPCPCPVSPAGPLLGPAFTQTHLDPPLPLCSAGHPPTLVSLFPPCPGSAHLGPSTWAACLLPMGSLAPPSLFCAQEHLHLLLVGGCYIVGQGAALGSCCVSVQPVSASAAHILGEVCREKQEAAIPLVRLFLHYGRVVPFISAIANAEVRRTQ